MSLPSGPDPYRDELSGCFIERDDVNVNVDAAALDDEQDTTIAGWISGRIAT